MGSNSQQSGVMPVLSVLLLFLIAEPMEILVCARIHSITPNRLFIFGDSYADTGNIDISPDIESWFEPYGMTYPGYPSGRFSDGRVFTDFFAQHIGLETPATYRLWKSNSTGVDTTNGMNFAFGGSGVFDTKFNTPNMTTQIDFLEKAIAAGVYQFQDLQESVALVSLSGNDYLSFLTEDISHIWDLLPFIGSVVDQLSINIKRIESLGVPNIVVNSLIPLGCTPTFASISGYQSCFDIINLFIGFHNTKLKDVISKYNDESEELHFYYLDLYNAFTQIKDNQVPHDIESLYEECCKGLLTENTCGDVDENGEKRYTVCDNVKTSFFWDKIHPTQAGWSTISSVLFDSTKQLSQNNFITMFPLKI